MGLTYFKWQSGLKRDVDMHCFHKINSIYAARMHLYQPVKKLDNRSARFHIQIFSHHKNKVGNFIGQAHPN